MSHWTTGVSQTAAWRGSHGAPGMRRLPRTRGQQPRPGQLPLPPLMGTPEVHHQLRLPPTHTASRTPPCGNLPAVYREETTGAHPPKPPPSLGLRERHIPVRALTPE